MKHDMHLDNDPFTKIKNGTKKYEIRLNDVKRKALRVGDSIIFTNRETNETMVVKVTDLHKYDTVKDIFDNLDNKLLGCKKTDVKKYYTDEEIKKYSLLVIGIERS